MVKMRLVRMGDKKSPVYRIVVVDARKAATGEYIEKIGFYDPKSEPVQLTVDVEKAKEWLAKGVQPTETVRSLLVRAGAMESPQNFRLPRPRRRKRSKIFHEILFELTSSRRSTSCGRFGCAERRA